MKFLIIFIGGLSQWLAFSVISLTAGQTINSSESDSSLVKKYVDFMKKLTFENPIENAIVKYFSNALKNKYWCYENYPCFQIGGPFISNYSPISLPPKDHLLKTVKMQLYTRANPNNPFTIDPNNVRHIFDSHFNSKIKTKFIIGGYLDGVGFFTAHKLIPALLAYDDYNVFHVYWFLGSLLLYPQVVANGRLVGAITGKFIENLNNLTGLPLDNVHIIGFSLGAHVAGHAGQYLNGSLGRISGVEPAGPLYEKTDKVVRLDESDAKFVDIMHTNAGSIFTLANGIDQKIGHIDIYPNGGSHQPGCPIPTLPIIKSMISMLFHSPYDFLVDAFNQIAQCNHARAVYLYVSSIKRNASCQFKSYACESYEAFLAGQCHQSCVANGEKCAMMGFHADDYAAKKYPLPSPYKFYLTTTDHPPYCKQQTF